MRITRINSTLIAAAVCASLTMGLAGTADAHAPVRIASADISKAADSADAAAATRAELIAKLGDTLSYGARITQDAQAQSPDGGRLQELSASLEQASRQFADLIDAAAAGGSVQLPDQSGLAAGRAKDGAKDGVKGGVKGGAKAAASTVDDIKAQLDKLITDVAALVTAVISKDLAAVAAQIAVVVGDLQGLLLLVPQLLTDILVPLPLGNDALQSPLSPAVPDASLLLPEAAPEAAPQADPGASLLLPEAAPEALQDFQDPQFQ
ncbi:hypothetical protein PV703_00235 [Streptomyces sp. ME01-24h]|nr:hypothetical protein [Streptomyces sp. ME19-03-3]MDX3351788.1 hypothetical protein [Streptomyces sp. ME01-24h]